MASEFNKRMSVATVVVIGYMVSTLAGFLWISHNDLHGTAVAKKIVAVTAVSTAGIVLYFLWLIFKIVKEYSNSNRDV